MVTTTTDRLIRLVRNEQTTLAGLAVLIGLAASLGCIAFRHLIAGTQLATWGAATERLASHVAELPWWLILLIPAGGGLVIGMIRRYLCHDGRLHAVADVVEATALRGGRIRLRDGLVAAAGSALTLGTGGSAGREGPVVHLGATMASLAAQKFGLRRSATMTLLGCGVAAAVDTSFNAPIAGVFFALEVVVGHYGLSAFAPVVLASVVGTIVTRIHYGDFPAFIVSDHAIVSFWEIPAFGILGVVAAVAAWVLMRSIFVVQDCVERLKIPMIAAPVTGGLLVGGIALSFPQVLGVGYEGTDLALNGGLALSFMIALAIAKIAATAFTLGCGFGGGVFSPSLFVGAMVGGAYGLIATSFMPEMASHHTVYAIVGMAAVAGAVLGAPISTILIVFELTANFDLTIAVMIGTALASLLVNHVGGRSFFQWVLERRGIDLSGGHAHHLLRSQAVSTIMSPAFASLAPADTFDTIRTRLYDHPNGNFVVVDDNGILVGVVTMEDLRSVLFGDTEEDRDLTAADLARLTGHVLIADDTLASALEAMEVCDDDFIPVVDGLETSKVTGILTQRSLVKAHNRALTEAAAERA